ncbi:MAG: mandelate racemase/muconate lactonizing enzyme family protein [Firmicutes bacterium]|nr:mandelate racemase/muconate lactonizing enzyme family protein [Bacillota bacterium]
MKIDQIKVHLLSCPVDDSIDWRSATGRPVKRDSVLVEIRTDEGLVGFGEAHHCLCPPAVEKIITSAYAPHLTGKDPTKIQDCLAPLFRMTYMLGASGAPIAAISAIDTALWDITGKAAGLPVYKLLGGSADKVRAYAGGWGLGWKEKSKLVEEAQEMLSYGYKALKVRVGLGFKRDLEVVEAIRSAVGDDVDILTDAAGSYDRTQARYVIEGLRDLGVYWLEEPLPAADLDGLIELSRARKLRIAYGESLFTHNAFHRPIKEQGIDVVQPDACKCGGILESRLIAIMAESAKIKFVPHIVGNAVATAANLQVLGSVRNGVYAEIDLPRTARLRESLLINPPNFIPENGEIKIPDGPGLGIEVNTEAFAEFPYIEGSCYKV